MKDIKIVLVEDDEILSKVIKEELEEANFKVHLATDGEKGLDLATSKKPNLVLLDLMLPKMHGFEVLENLKKSPETAKIPVMILTMLGSDDDIKKGLLLGANDYIVKSQHAVGEIVDKVKEFFVSESNPEGKESSSPNKEKEDKKS
ncbi:MAG: response regulator [Patescibacteria group bacterium]|nr:response regulator [Patescibacteria group bacterium]